MKKVLFGICALAISASAFGAVMSSTEVPDSKGEVSVALPVRLEANVVDGSKRLFIEGTSGDKFGDVLVLNFGDLAKGKRGETEGKIRVFRGDTWTTKYEATKLGGTVDFSFIIDGEDTGKDGAAGINQYYPLVMTNTVVTSDGTAITNPTPNVAHKKFSASIALTNMTFDGGQTTKEATYVEGKIGALTEVLGNDVPPGKYYGAASVVATLKIDGGP